ncbi:MAG: hypothetical protein R2856_22805 [Caldilineaceae bacterium]
MTVQRGGIVDGKEDIQQIGKADHRWIVGDLHHLGMSCAAGANLFVGGVWHAPVGVARDDFFHTLQLQIDGFQTPKAATGQRGHFHVLGTVDGFPRLVSPDFKVDQLMDIDEKKRDTDCCTGFSGVPD